jgi:hypothetical protein
MVYTRISNGLALVATLFALAGAMVLSSPNLANAQQGSPILSSSTSTAKPKGAPGPIAGAGLPVLAVGFGVYWLIKRRRRKAE